MHRFLLGAQPGEIVDHKNGNTLDNRKDNLRRCTHQQNMRNRRVARTTRTGFKGVSWSDHTEKFRATINVAGKQRHLGYFDTSEKAAAAYDRAAVDLYGEFARVNFKEKISG